MIGLNWISGLPTTAAGFDMNHVDLLSGKVHAVPTRSTATATATATAADAAAIICDMCLRSGDSDGFPDVLVVDHDSNQLHQ